MNIRFLETFVWLAKLQNFRLTAEKLGTTQAAVSSRIASLESDLNTRLFLRHGRSTSLTPAGVTLLGTAERIVRLRDEMQHALDGQLASAGLLRIGVIEWVLRSWFPSLMREINTRYPALRLEVIPGTSRQLAAMLLNDDLDIIFCLEANTLAGCTTVPLGKFDMCWLASPALNLHGSTLGLSQLAGQQIIGFMRDTSASARLDQLFATAGIRPSRLHHVGSVDAVIRLLMDAQGIAVMPRAAVATEVADNALVVLDVEAKAVFGPLALVAHYRSHSQSMSGSGASDIAEAISRLARQSAAKSTIL